jgi:phosphatidylglycerophosphate synthase
MALSETRMERRLRSLSTGRPDWVVTAFALWALAGLLALALAGPLLLPPVPMPGWVLSGVLYTIGAVAVGAALRRSYPHETLGACNVVTLARMTIVASLVAPLTFGPSSGWIVFGLASVALALDGVDGWLARRDRRASEFGARFDMEVDSAFALVLSLHALGTAGPLVLVLGLARYAFVVATLFLPWLARPLPERFSRKVVCVVQLATLILLQVPFIPPPAATLLVTAASLALAWSFGRDIAYLRRLRA